MISFRAIAAASARSVDPLAETDATTTGAELKLNAPTVGSTVGGSVAASEVGLDARRRLVEVGPVVELGDHEGERVRRRRSELGEARDAGDRALDRLRDLFGHVRCSRDRDTARPR